ncbi:hypothetical protein LCGC14_0889860 [marine sediment metagenome]|uniref:Uncharacterized protein n=1 Tax=marine sediment metagenome TaxID=412755 RepID=A0A0F9S6K1_9ZZZZ
MQRMAEAAHCILGSLGKHGRGQEWIDTLEAEQAHVEEEAGIIRMVMQEYSRDLYTDRLHDGYYEAKDVQATVQSVQTAGPKLTKQAQLMLERWSAVADEVPPAIHELASLTYMLLIELGDAAEGAAVDYPAAEVQNPYRDPKLVSAVQYLLDATANIYRDVEKAEQSEEGASRTGRITRILSGDTAPTDVKTFVYRDHLYREALTSEQKKLKKKYLLKQQMQDKKPIPTWEDVLDRYGDEMRTAAEDYLGYMDFRLYLEQWLERYDYDIEDEAVVKHFEQQVYDDFIVEEVEKAFLHHYEKAVDRLSTVDGQDCWREIDIPRSVDPTRLASVGRYWTLDKDSASALESDVPHDADHDLYRVVRFHGRVNGQYIDPEVIYANMYGHANRIEADAQEVRFYQHAPVFVYSVDVWDRMYESGEPETIEIDDWRTA